MKVRKTVIISGSNNGGTSLIAAMCEKMGFFMGTERRVFEDHAMIYKLREGGQKLTDFILERNMTYELWGFKEPRIGHKLLEIERVMYEPHFIIVFRDPVAIASRRGKITGYELGNKALMALDLMREFLKVRKQLKRVLLVSYEKTLLYPNRTITDMSKFLGVEVDAKIVEELMSAVKPENGHPPLK